jgi:hypothetical protein
MEHCVVCDFKTETDGEFEKHACLKVPEIEHAMINAILMAKFCDHYCCGMSDERCKAQAILRELADMGYMVERDPNALKSSIELSD